MRLHALSQFEKWKNSRYIRTVRKGLCDEAKYVIKAPFSHYWIYVSMKIQFEIWNWSWKLQLFLLLFFQKDVKFFNFSFKYIKMKASYKEFDYGRWRTNYIFLWYPFNLWTSIEMVEKIPHFDDFLGHFSDWREKSSKWNCRYPYIDGSASFTLKL